MSRPDTRNVLIPSARRLVTSLRDMGYDFAAAVADLVDNSIEASATRVAIDIDFDGNDSSVRIADNGTGMTPPQLREALRYGADRDYQEEDLGKFGLGLKTASFSQCQRLTVASRTNPNRADVRAYCWDLDHINKTDSWEILPLDRDDLGPNVRGPLKDTTGTVVLWQRLDRILGYRLPHGESARKRLCAMCREVEAHLAMVFHRFLSGEVRGRKLTILVNGNCVVPWDPFAREEAKTRALPRVSLKVEHEDVSGQLVLEPFVLPHQQDFSSSDAFRQASGPLNWNQQQGFYIYRAGRLIQSGGWCRLRTVDEHSKLARIALSFRPELDEAFKINVAKMRVQLPPQIRDQIDQAIKPVVRLAKETYGKRSPVPPGPASGNGHRLAPTTSTRPGRPGGGTTRSGGESGEMTRPGQRLWTLDDLQRQLEAAAEAAELPVITTVCGRVRGRLDREGADDI